MQFEVLLVGVADDGLYLDVLHAELVGHAGVGVVGPLGASAYTS